MAVPHRNRRAPGVLLLGLLGLAQAGSGIADPPAPRSDEITAGELRDMVRALADDALEGRETGEPGCERAADLVAAELSRLGLHPAGADGSWFQPFTIPRGVRVLPTTSLSVTDAAGAEHAFALASAFVPLDVSGAGDVAGDVVFAGYGITAPDLRYDDYAGLDAHGKVAVVLRHAPAWQVKGSPFSDPKVLEKSGSFAAKAEAAAKAGALALVIVNDPASSGTPEKDDLRAPGGGTTGRIPVVQVAWRAAPALERALGLSLEARQAALDAAVAPSSLVLTGPRLRVRCDLEPLVRQAKNVAALLRADAEPGVTGVETGSASRPAPVRETVVVGAHYDHVGRGRFGEPRQGGRGDPQRRRRQRLGDLRDARDRGPPRRRSPPALRRNVLFLAFSGEELGLFGSRHYVSKPARAARGHGRDGQPRHGGATRRRPALRRRVRDLAALALAGRGPERAHDGLAPALDGPAVGAPSDHDSFYAKGIPVLFFFTGLHADYHRPTDDWDKIDYAGEERVARLAALVLEDLLTRPDRPSFAKADDHGFDIAPTLGLTLDPAARLHVLAVDDHGTARRAGLAPGDVLLAWNGTPLQDAKDLETRVSKSGFGEVVELIVERDGTIVPVLVAVGST